MEEYFAKRDKDLALALRALANPIRLNILRIIALNCQKQCCCADITNSLNLAQSTISQHIKILLNAGLITRKTKGTKNCYYLCPNKLFYLKSSYADFLTDLQLHNKKGENSE